MKEEAKLPSRVYKGLFRKGIMNNMSYKMKALMLPQKEPTLAKKLRSGEIISPRPNALDIEFADPWLDFSEKSPLDLKPVGSGSVLDDLFAIEPDVPERPNRGDSGGSDHTKDRPQIIVEDIQKTEKLKI